MSDAQERRRRSSLLRQLRQLMRVDSPALLVASRLASSALMFVSAPIVARAIGPQGRGVTSAVVAIAYLLPIVLAFGVPLELRRRTALGECDTSTRAARLWAAVTIVPSVIIAFVLTSTLFGFLAPNERVAVFLCVASAPLTVSWMCDNSVLVAQGRFRALVALQIAQPLTYTGLAVMFWLTRTATVSNVIGANLAGTVATFVLGLLLNRVTLVGKLAPVKKMARQSIRYAGSAAAEAASNRLDQVMVLPLIGAYQAGLYSVAASIAALPIAFGHALGAAYFPHVALAAEESRRDLKASAMRHSLALGGAVCLLGAMLTPWLMPLLFGREFAGAIVPTVIALAGSVAMIGAFVGTQLLGAEGRGLMMTNAQVAAIAGAVISLVVLGPPFGAVGAAAASTMGFIVLLIMVTIGLRIGASRLVPRPDDLRSALGVLKSGISTTGRDRNEL
ncbi:MAG: oligosaccharide flippase family protein [Propionibacteriaceae bacterium]|nr:oligosaccharide flippase family protein [Propionibacteriaceae bacterium]